MRVSDLARRANTTSETVRHYTDLGILTPERNQDNGYRHYSQQDLQQLNFALKARHLGFTLPDIQTLIAASREGDTPCGQVRELIGSRLKDVEAQIEALQSLSQRMRQAMAEWAAEPDQRLDDGRVCGLIDSFVNPPAEKP